VRPQAAQERACEHERDDERGEATAGDREGAEQLDRLTAEHDAEADDGGEVGREGAAGGHGERGRDGEAEQGEREVAGDGGER
jgi:hypothetical protein